MQLCLKNLTVLCGILKDPVLCAFADYIESPDEKKRAAFLCALYEADAADNFAAYVAQRILCTENAFARCCAFGKAPSPYVRRALLLDLACIYRSLYELCFVGEDFCLGTAEPPFFGNWANEKTLQALCCFFAENGYGTFVGVRAFAWKRGRLTPLKGCRHISLTDLKDYAAEKQVIRCNVERFLHGLPYANMLLYGDKGTGKSSTIHAVLNEYYHCGLRLVAVKKEELSTLSDLTERLASEPLHFIVFIDDLSLSASDPYFSTLKSAMEGDIAGQCGNVLIAVTSNRRHIVREKNGEREDDLHASDAQEEELSLSDRFGLKVLFSTTNKEEYLSIVRQLAQERRIKMEDEKLCSLAERYALQRGGRSPRCARQFIDSLE